MINFLIGLAIGSLATIAIAYTAFRLSLRR